MINFIIGQLVGLVEPFLAIDFIIKCLEWKDQVKHRKQLYIGVCLVWFIVAQGNGRFAGSVKCLDDMGVGSILFNLLDNAIEACEKNQKEKRIICRIAREADEVNIFVENDIEQSVLTENQSLETTKDKKDQHGMGHLIVEEQVKRLGGMVEYYEDEMFCAHVYLPV